jgi:DNA-binding transcriptional ArsR family regulator
VLPGAVMVVIMVVAWLARGWSALVGMAHLAPLVRDEVNIVSSAQACICAGNATLVPVVSVPEATSTGAPHPDVLDEARVQAAVMSFALLADATRVRLLWALREHDADVASLAQTAGCRPTVASQHLAKLRFAGLVEGRRDGRRVFYRLRGAHVRNLLAEALFHADHQVSGEPVHD